MGNRKIRKWSPKEVIYMESLVDDEEYEKIIEELGHIFYNYFRQLHLNQNSSKISKKDTSQNIVRS